MRHLRAPIARPQGGIYSAADPRYGAAMTCRTRIPARPRRRRTRA